MMAEVEIVLALAFGRVRRSVWANGVRGYDDYRTQDEAQARRGSAALTRK